MSVGNNLLFDKKYYPYDAYISIPINNTNRLVLLNRERSESKIPTIVLRRLVCPLL